MGRVLQGLGCEYKPMIKNTNSAALKGLTSLHSYFFSPSLIVGLQVACS